MGAETLVPAALMRSARWVCSAIGDAEKSCFGITVFIPEAAACAQVMGLGSGNPVRVLEAAQDWMDAHSQLQEAAQQLPAVLAGLTDQDWTGKDRDAFDAKMTQYQSQLRTAASAAQAAGATTAAAGGALAAFMTLAIGVTVALVADAAIVAAADATIIGAPEAEAEGAAFGAACLAILEGGLTALTGVVNACAGVFAGGAFGEAKVLQAEGDAEALQQLAAAAKPQGLIQTEITGLDEVLRPLAEKAGKIAGEAGKTDPILWPAPPWTGP